MSSSSFSTQNNIVTGSNVLQDHVIPAEGMNNRDEEGGSSVAVESVTFATNNQEEITTDSSSEGMNSNDEEGGILKDVESVTSATYNQQEIATDSSSEGMNNSDEEGSNVLQDHVIPAEGMNNRDEEGGSSAAVESVTFATNNQEEITTDSSSEGMNRNDEEGGILEDVESVTSSTYNQQEIATDSSSEGMNNRDEEDIEVENINTQGAENINTQGAEHINAENINTQGAEHINAQGAEHINAENINTQGAEHINAQGAEHINAENINTQGAENDEWLRVWGYTKLLKATIEGKWETAQNVFDGDNSALTAAITKNKDTALHIAIGTGKKNIHFVENLVERLPAEALAKTNSDDETPLHLAASFGNTEAARILVAKHPLLVYKRSQDLKLPIHCAAQFAKRKTLLYLLEVTTDGEAFQGHSGAKFIKYLVTSNLYDIALEMVEIYPHLAILRDDVHGESGLGWMPSMVSAFKSRSGLNFWQRLVYDYIPVKLESVNIEGHSRTGHDVEDPPNNTAHVHEDNQTQSLGEHNSISSVPQIKHIREKKQIHDQACQLVRTLCMKITQLNDIDAFTKIAPASMNTAIGMGIHEIIEEIAESFPSLILAKNANILNQAIRYRHANIFNLVYQMSDRRHNAVHFMETPSQNSILHVAGLKSPDNKLSLIPGAALQMQHELQWFEEVKKFVRPVIVELHNERNETPAMLFTKQHEDLVDKGERWMKDTANSCTITAALIVTVVFAAAITFPGGHKGDTGLPIFSHQPAFITFVVADTIALFTSVTSLLMFLSILTSRYAEGDFLYVLPTRLILGLVTLFLSITTMMVAFSSTLYLVFGQNKAWILIPIAALACLPITSFITLQFPLLIALISSTYGKGIFGKQSNRPLY